jgi:hypothetical protein
MSQVDIAEAVGFDRDAARTSIRHVNPTVSILETSARTGAGMDEWIAVVETADRSEEFDTRAQHAVIAFPQGASRRSPS